MRAKLVVVGGETQTSEIDLKFPAVFGRGRDTNVNLPHPLVSRRHCQIDVHNGMLQVRDLGSLNGTFIGSQRISVAVLNPGDLLTVGTVTFRAIYDAPCSDDTIRANMGDTERIIAPARVSSVAMDEDQKPLSGSYFEAH